MKALNRKLQRDVWRSRGQVLSIAAIVACGVMTSIAMRSTLDVILDARQSYYDNFRFADVFALLNRAPESLTSDIASIPGVATVETRVSLQVTLRVPGLNGPATGLLTSVPSVRRPMLNDLLIRRGRYVAPDRNDEVIVSERFVQENSLELGDELGAVINGRWQALRIVGIGTSPEHVYEIGRGGIFVDNQRFAVLWMRREAVAAAAGYSGAFNDVTLTTAPNASERAILSALDRMLEPYGGVGAVGRDQQPSNKIIDGEIQQLKSIGRVLPIFFMATAAFLLNVVLSRLIASQRDEIGALKAFGYSNLAIGLHFIGFALASVAVGALLGVILGAWLGTAYTGLYAEYFRFPDLAFTPGFRPAATAILVSLLAALAGTVGAARKAMRLPPAEALRPPSPSVFRPLVMERMGLRPPASITLRMIMRTIERRPFKSISSVIGIALAVALLVTGLFPYDGVNRLLHVQFNLAQREDLSVSFNKVRPASALHELESVPGVTQVEAVRSTPVRIYHKARARTTALMGMDADAALRRLVDDQSRAHRIPAGGMVLSAALAEALDLRVGDSARVRLLDRPGENRTLVVVGTVPQFVDFFAYMERRELNAILREADAATGAYLLVDSEREEEVFQRLSDLPHVAGVASRSALLRYFRTTMAESLYISAAVIVFAASVIAVGVVYNSARIALAERGRELATLRVLGFTRREVGTMLTGEQLLITVVGIPVGCLIGLGLATILGRSFSTEELRIPVVVEPRSFLIAGTVIALSAAGVALIVRRWVRKLDVIGALKTGE